MDQVVNDEYYEKVDTETKSFPKKYFLKKITKFTFVSNFTVNKIISLSNKLVRYLKGLWTYFRVAVKNCISF